METCLDHRVFRLNDDGTLKDIVYQGSQNELDQFLDEDRTKSKIIKSAAVIVNRVGKVKNFLTLFNTF